MFVDDEDDTERRKGDCLEDIQFLEQQFTDLKEMYVPSLNGARWLKCRQ